MSKDRIRTAALLATLFVACDAHALFIVNQPWVKPGARTSEAYMVLRSTEGATLIGARSAIAARASIRVRGARGGKLVALPLPPGAAVSLRPGADRIVLTGLTRTLKLGDRVPLTLEIATTTGEREQIAVNAEVRNEWPADAERRPHRH